MIPFKSPKSIWLPAALKSQILNADGRRKVTRRQKCTKTLTSVLTPNRYSPEHGQIYVEATAVALEKFDREIQKYDSYPDENQSIQPKSIDALQVTGTK